MCGIFGAFNHELTDDDIMRMADSLRHRGPDGMGVYQGNHVTLGSRRLEIIGGQNGKQPLKSEDGKKVLVFNGEIYNYASLKQELLSRGHRFGSESDGEVLIHLYEEYGRNLFSRINGQFAFALYDADKDKLFVARDQTGICPLYYRKCGESIYFASEVKALAFLHRKRISFRPENLYEQFTYWTTLDERTVYQDVFQIPPSCYGEIQRNGDVQIQRYHEFRDFEEDCQFRDFGEMKDRLYRLLESSIKARIMCDDNIKWGMYLSGGLDSTIILRLLNRMGVKEFPTFSLAFQSRNIDESVYQKLACKDCKVDHRVIEVTERDIVEQLSQVLNHCEMPIYKFGAVPMYILSREARKDNIKFVLSGEGADELFYGYDIYKETLFRKLISNQINSKIRTSNVKAVVPPQARGDRYMLEGYKQYYMSQTDNVGNPLFSIRPRIETSSLIYDYFNPELQHKIDKDLIKREVEQHYDNSKDLGMLKKCQNVQMDNLLAGYLLSMQGDRVLMANSVEGRFPFLDPRLISFAYSIPEYLKLHGYNEKYILKETFSDILPRQIKTRQKFQYSTPGAHIIMEYYDYFEQFLSKEVCEECGMFQYSLIHKLLQEERHSITTDMLLVYVTTTHMLQSIIRSWGD